ncbi:MAG: DUF2357 domain-containing protein [Candidatus Izemoplasmataceae bacterium]
MSILDLYYRAFKAFRNHTKEDTTSEKLRQTIAHANQDEDILTSIKYDCVIEKDWIENIEEGLIYIEKAIREDRQFIRTEGEVIPIEKVKKVSRTSIEHLSRHSDYITREPKDKQADLIPEKLYVVEKLNDYLVYENRFLYMLLCYLKDFIQMRLDKIKDKTTIYQSHMTLNKVIDENQRHLTYQLNYSDIYKNDPLLTLAYRQIPLVDRVENIYAIVMALLGMPLMKEVSKAPLIKPPVIKTNVLRMNPNFRAALKLYDFVTAYSKDGYTITENKKTFNPFSHMMADEIAETIELTSIIAYVEGNDLGETLKSNYEAYEESLKAIENKKAKEELKRLKKRMIEMNEDPTEYILKLEKRNAQLEKDTMELATIKALNIELEEQIKALQEKEISLNKEIEDLNLEIIYIKEEIDRLNQKYFDDMTYAEAIHKQEINSLVEEHLSYIDTMNKTHEASILKLKREHEDAIISLKASHQKNIQDLTNEHNLQIDQLHKDYETQIQSIHHDYQTKIHVLDQTINEINQTLSDERIQFEKTQETHKKIVEDFESNVTSLKRKVKRLDEEKRFEHAQYIALKQQQGLLSDQEDFTSKDRFKQLELEMIAYKKLFKEQWKKAKNQIREKVKEETFKSEDNSISKDN